MRSGSVRARLERQRPSGGAPAPCLAACWAPWRSPLAGARSRCPLDRSAPPAPPLARRRYGANCKTPVLSVTSFDPAFPPPKPLVAQSPPPLVVQQQPPLVAQSPPPLLAQKPPVLVVQNPPPLVAAPKFPPPVAVNTARPPPKVGRRAPRPAAGRATRTLRRRRTAPSCVSQRSSATSAAAARLC